MFEITAVKDCPVTRASVGRVRVKKWILGELLGTLLREPSQEWAVWLVGTRSENGLDVVVDGAKVPTQRRSVGNVVIPQMEIPSEVVGVLHSHHGMGAFFSGTDNQEFNTRYALSIVISSKYDQNEKPATWFGFRYKAEGRVLLPCGGLGVVPFVMEPLEEFEGWPRVEPKLEASEEAMKKGLGDCNSKGSTADDRDLYVRLKGTCGVEANAVTPKYGAFGVGAGNMAKLLSEPVVDVDRGHKGSKDWRAKEAAADKEYAEISAGRKRWLGKTKPEQEPALDSGEERGVANQIATNVVAWLRRKGGGGDREIEEKDEGPLNQYDLMTHLKVDWEQMAQDEQHSWIADCKMLWWRADRLGIMLSELAGLTLEEADTKVTQAEEHYRSLLGEAEEARFYVEGRYCDH
jgi:proteasome lid subunit RPN8/RPN11